MESRVKGFTEVVNTIEMCEQADLSWFMTSMNQDPDEQKRKGFRTCFCVLPIHCATENQTSSGG